MNSVTSNIDVSQQESDLAQRGSRHKPLNELG